MNKPKTKQGVALLLRLARFKRECRKLEPLKIPLAIRDAAKKQGIIIKD